MPLDVGRRHAGRIAAQLMALACLYSRSFRLDARRWRLFICNKKHMDYCANVKRVQAARAEVAATTRKYDAQNSRSAITRRTGSASPVPNSFVAEQKYSPAVASSALSIIISSPACVASPRNGPFVLPAPQCTSARVSEFGSQWKRAGSPLLTCRIGGLATGRGGAPIFFGSAAM